MAVIGSNLWEYNLAKVLVIDVSDDYQLQQPPLPPTCYPVLHEAYFPVFEIVNRLIEGELVDGFQYDWHQEPNENECRWIVGMVRAGLLDLELELDPENNPGENLRDNLREKIGDPFGFNPEVPSNHSAQA